jgi:phosphoribosylglycinamide formyltransferase-1
MTFIKPKKLSASGMPSSKKKLAVFASGGGSNLRAIYDATRGGVLRTAEVSLIISNNSKCGALRFAIEKDIAAEHISPVKYGSEVKAEEKTLQVLQALGIDLIVLAGYMKKLPDSVVEKYNGKIVNIHPALLPKHGGEGMYGLNVHKAVLASGDAESGSTVHFVEGEYDTGEIIMQERCSVLPSDSPEVLQHRVKDIEYALYPKAIASIL